MNAAIKTSTLLQRSRSTSPEASRLAKVETSSLVEASSGSGTWPNQFMAKK